MKIILFRSIRSLPMLFLIYVWDILEDEIHHPMVFLYIEMEKLVLRIFLKLNRKLSLILMKMFIVDIKQKILNPNCKPKILSYIHSCIISLRKYNNKIVFWFGHVKICEIWDVCSVIFCSIKCLLVPTTNIGIFIPPYIQIQIFLDSNESHLNKPV